MVEHLIDITLANMALFFEIVLATFLLSWLVHLLIIAFFRDRVEKSTYRMFSRISTYLIFVLGISFALNNILQFRLGATLATLGILGGLLILPFIPVLQSVAAGVVIAIERSFKEEDVIEMNGKLCIVKDINLRKTSLRSLNGEIFYVPNVKFMTEPIVNFTAGEFIKVVQSIEFPLNIDFEKIKLIIEGVCLNNQNILPNIPQKKISSLEKLFSIPKNFFSSKKNTEKLRPKIFIKNIYQNKITLEVWFWIWDVKLRENIISGFFEDVMNRCKKDKIKLS